MRRKKTTQSEPESFETAMREVIYLLESPERWPGLDDAKLLRFADLAIALYAVTCREPMIRRLVQLYRLCVERFAVDERLEMFKRLEDGVIAGALTVNAMLPFLFEDPDLAVVSSATMAFAANYPLSDGDPMTGPRAAVRVLRTMTVANRAGIFAGLLLMGDRRVTALLREVEPELTREERYAAAFARTGFLNAGTVEFWLELLERCPGDADDVRFGAAAAALERLAETAAVPFVTEVQRSFPPVNDEGEPIATLERWSVEEYSQRIAPRLLAIAAREPEPRVMPRVLEAWGIKEPQTPVRPLLLERKVAN